MTKAASVDTCFSPAVAEREDAPMNRATDSSPAELINATASILWVLLAFVALFVIRRIITARGDALTKLGISPTSGVTMEFAEAKISEAVRVAAPDTSAEVGVAAKKSIVDRLQRNASLLARARIVWVDDHPENNVPVVQLLRQYGAAVETPTSNAEALPLMQGSLYDVVVSDVARDDEGENSDLKGIELAKEINARWGQRCILFTTYFDPVTVPGLSDQQRLALVDDIQRAVFRLTNRMDEALHLILDLLER